MIIKQTYRIGLLLAIILMLLVACGTSASSNTSSLSSTNASTPVAPACPTVNTANGQHAYAIVSKQTQASYQVKEKFLNRPLPNLAVGKTNSVQGGFLLQTTGQPSISHLKISVNLQTLTSDSAHRDDAIRQNWLQSATYPLATFVVKNAQPVANTFSQGQAANFKLTGDMTIHNTTHQETFNVNGKLVGETISGTATSLVYMKNYGFEAPSIMNLLTVTDGVTITLNFSAQQASCLTN